MPRVVDHAPPLVGRRPEGVEERKRRTLLGDVVVVAPVQSYEYLLPKRP